MPSNTKSKTTQLVLGTMLLLLAVGLAGCGGSRADRAEAPDHRAQDSASADRDAASAVEPDPITATLVENPTEKPTGAPSGFRAEIEPPSAAASRPMGAATGSGDVQRKAAALSAPKISVVPDASATGATSSSAAAPSAALAPWAPTAAPPEAAAASAAVPRALMAAPAPTGADAPMSAPAVEPLPEPAAAAPSTTAKASMTAPSDEFTLVKVFYGTDRQAITDAALHPLGRVPWSLLAAGAGGLTLLLVVVLCFARRSGALRLATGLSLVATIALVVCMIQIPRNTKPETADTSLAYGNGRGDLALGVCEVSIPKDHQVGELESPSILSLEVNEDPEKHVVLMSVERQEPETFYEQLRQRIAESQLREAFVFVHGYNVTFENAARRTAQLAHDLKFDGAPIFYSWPSQGGLLQYTVDETNVVWTVPHLKDFLLAVAQKTDARRVHLIAHSMGNRALTAALAQLATETKDGQTKLFHEVLLTAPDIDADIFRRDIVPAIVRTANRVTLYASSHDAALEASKKVHGYPRAGESGDNIVVIAGIDTIDVSAVDTSLVGHSYYGDSDTVLVDMAQLLHEQKPPDLRARLRKTTLDTALGTFPYWLFLAQRVAQRSGTTQ